MQILNQLNLDARFKNFINRLKRDGTVLLDVHRKKVPYVIGVFLLLIIYSISRTREPNVSILRSEGSPNFKDARILGSNADSIYEGKERLMSKSMREIMAAQTALRESNEKLQERIAEMEKEKLGPQPTPSPAALQSMVQGVSDSVSASQSSTASETGVRLGSEPELMNGPRSSIVSSGFYSGRSSSRGWDGHSGGPSVISFPVKDIPMDKVEGVVLPSGSYVKAKLMTGVEAPESKTFPVLLQLDYAYIIPNKKRLDLTGCFMIAKSQGDLSTERVQMQATKLSCVSKRGKMFEREVNGFVADDKDNSFAVMGKVNSKQDRVAAMAFLSSIVEGVGKAVQQAQTTQSTNALGGSQSVLTGDQATYIGAGGASNAASMVTQWYLKQAQNLLPTINVGSGQDVWIVMQDKVALPNDYFRRNQKGENRDGMYSYFSRFVD